jgi:hypothetical protein
MTELISWNGVKKYLAEHELTREQRIDLLNYFNKEINAFPIEDCVVIQPNGMVLANGRQMTLEQRESFLQGARALMNNTAFNLIADQVVYQSMKVGIHDATHLDHLYFSKTAMYFIDLFKKYLEKIDKLA